MSEVLAALRIIMAEDLQLPLFDDRLPSLQGSRPGVYGIHHAGSPFFYVVGSAIKRNGDKFLDGADIWRVELDDEMIWIGFMSGSFTRRFSLSDPASFKELSHTISRTHNSDGHAIVR